MLQHAKSTRSPEICERKFRESQHDTHDSRKVNSEANDNQRAGKQASIIFVSPEESCSGFLFAMSALKRISTK